jgi:hypothetical protein
MAAKYSTFSFSSPSKINPNWNFWYENMHTIWQPCSEKKLSFFPATDGVLKPFDEKSV